MITDSNQAYFTKVSSCRLQEGREEIGVRIISTTVYFDIAHEIDDF